MILSSGNDSILKIKVQPSAFKNEILGVVMDALKIKVTAPATDGKANKACVKLLSRTLGIGKGRVIIMKGLQAREKLVLIKGISKDNLIEHLER